VDVSRRVYSQHRNNGEIVFGILKLFRRGTIISLEMSRETRRLIQRAAAVRGCTVNEFIIKAAMRRAREILTGQNSQVQRTANATLSTLLMSPIVISTRRAVYGFAAAVGRFPSMKPTRLYGMHANSATIRIPVNPMGDS
jgi:uncharacterized protein (DUF1778 family)